MLAITACSSQPVMQSVIKPIDDSGRDKESPKCMVIPVDDMADTNLLQHFPMCIAFIKQALAADSKVLVHCAMGISRSCTASLLSKFLSLPLAPKPCF